MKDANITLWTESKIAVDSFNEGLFAEVRITSPAIDPVSETITLSHTPDGGQYCTDQ